MAIIFHCNGIFIFHSSVDGHLVCLRPLAFMNNCCSVAKLCLTLCDSVDYRLSCLSPSPAVCPDSCPLSGRCCLTISSSAAPFSFCLQSFLASRPFPMSPLSASSGQSTGASASAAVLPMNIHGWFPLGSIILLRKCVHTYPEDTEGWLHPSVHTRDLSILRFWCPRGSWNKAPEGQTAWEDCMCFCGHMFSFLLGTYLGVELLDHMVILCLTFPGTTRLFSKLARLYIPIIGVWGLRSLCVLVNTYSSLSTSACTLEICKSWRRKWQPTPVFLPGKVHGQRSLAGCSPWGYMTEHVWDGLVAVNW